MNPSAPAGDSPPDIRDDSAALKRDPQKAGGLFTFPATDAGAHRTDQGAGSQCIFDHDSSGYVKIVSSVFAASDLMSMRHPVIRAASLAFCPSRPIANESW